LWSPVVWTLVSVLMPVLAAALMLVVIIVLAHAIQALSPPPQPLTS